jgi:hypothetical protein
MNESRVLQLLITHTNFDSNTTVFVLIQRLDNHLNKAQDGLTLCGVDYPIAVICMLTTPTKEQLVKYLTRIWHFLCRFRQ